MGQPNPPGDIPLYEGLGADWNDIVSAFPEDKRAELAPRLKQRLDETVKPYEPLKAYEDFHRSGITPDQIGTALQVFSTIENNPRQIYDTIGKYLNITPAEAKEAVENIQDGTTSDDPRLQRIEQQLETLARVTLAEKQQTTAEKQLAEQEAALDRELSGLRKKYGDDFDEEEILMRMAHKDLSAEKAYEDYMSKASEIRKRRPSPMILGGGGMVPQRTLDVTKLNTSDTKNLVAQMMQQARNET